MMLSDGSRSHFYWSWWFTRVRRRYNFSLSQFTRFSKTSPSYWSSVKPASSSDFPNDFQTPLENLRSFSLVDANNLQAYGEVIWFSGSVSSLTLVSFGLMVLSSLIAAWSDISPFLSSSSALEQSISEPLIYGEIVKKNMGYFWMLVNCFASAAYVSNPHSSFQIMIWYFHVEPSS